MGLTKENILKTREHFANICLGCIEEVKNGDVKVYCSHEEYFKRRLEERKHILNGEFDHTLTFIQYATYLQTGEMRAVLP